MALDHLPRFALHPRHWLKLGVSAAAAWLPRTVFVRNPRRKTCALPSPKSRMIERGTMPVPDSMAREKRQSQPARHAECRTLEHLQFKGKLGRCNSFQGTGTSHKGNRLTWALHHRLAALRAGTGRDAGRNKLS